MVVIYGKDRCPYTLAARVEYQARGPMQYIDVTRDPVALERMLQYSGGKRRVPVIVDGDRVEIGFGGT
jgi:glutaredoxin 3